MIEMKEKTMLAVPQQDMAITYLPQFPLFHSTLLLFQKLTLNALNQKSLQCQGARDNLKPALALGFFSPSYRYGFSLHVPTPSETYIRLLCIPRTGSFSVPQKPSENYSDAQRFRPYSSPQCEDRSAQRHRGAPELTLYSCIGCTCLVQPPASFYVDSCAVTVYPVGEDQEGWVSYRCRSNRKQ
uniref:Uncharacterized protein n=1 Tax=Xenopus tropicalis TaxID=8364 RepID=A0A1B8XY93_XENTR